MFIAPDTRVTFMTPSPTVSARVQVQKPRLMALERRDRESLAEAVRNGPHVARHRVRVLVCDGTAATKTAVALPHHKTVKCAADLARLAYDTLRCTFAERTDTRRHLYDASALHSSEMQLYTACQSIQAELFGLEAFASGTPFADALALERAQKGIFGVRLEAKDGKDVKNAPGVTAGQKKASKEDANGAAKGAVPAAAPLLMYTARARDVLAFGGPYWRHIPSFHLWLASNWTSDDTKFSTSLLQMCVTYLKTHPVHPSVTFAASAALNACVKRFCGVMSKLRGAMFAWRKCAPTGPGRSVGIDVMASGAFWDTINRCCFITGETTEVMFELGIAPDVMERVVLPELARVGAMAVKTGTRCISITRQQVGYGEFSAFSRRDEHATCFVLEPEQLCTRMLKSSDATSRAVAAEFRRVSLLDDWLRVASALHSETEPSRRVYPRTLA